MVVNRNIGSLPIVVNLRRLFVYNSKNNILLEKRVVLTNFILITIFPCDILFLLFLYIFIEMIGNPKNSETSKAKSYTLLSNDVQIFQYNFFLKMWFYTFSP